MLEALGRVAREARKAAGLTQAQIGSAAEVDHAVISNLERGVRWPRELDPIIAAYESECGLPAHELWRRAVDLLP